jgi:hypothetical protein
LPGSGGFTSSLRPEKLFHNCLARVVYGFRYRNASSDSDFYP